jgi:hypothetical protein
MPYIDYSIKRAIRKGNANSNNRLYNNSRLHLIGIVFCALLLLGDFVTTSIALSAGSIMTAAGTVTLSEGNPLMAGIVNDPMIFFMSKGLILGLVVAAAFILKDNGFLSYMPYVIVGGMYFVVVVNNMSLLMSII